MNIGDRVIGKKTGPLVPSNVIAIVNADFALEHLQFDPLMFPDLEDGELFYVCEFDKPIPMTTKKTLKDSIVKFATNEDPFFAELVKHESLFNKYLDYYISYHVKKVKIACYPGSDLELVYD